jgi:hypothetical protein
MYGCLYANIYAMLYIYLFIYKKIQIISTIRSELVKRVVLDYNPQLHHEVGPYPMVTHVTTTSKDGVNHEHCYEIWITILDTNECDEKEHPEWRHQCDESTTCVNTEGGYYCACAGIKTRLDLLFFINKINMHLFQHICTPLTFIL